MDEYIQFESLDDFYEAVGQLLRDFVEDNVRTYGSAELNPKFRLEDRRTAHGFSWVISGTSDRQKQPIDIIQGFDINNLSILEDHLEDNAETGGYEMKLYTYHDIVADRIHEFADSLVFDTRRAECERICGSEIESI